MVGHFASARQANLSRAPQQPVMLIKPAKPSHLAQSIAFIRMRVRPCKVHHQDGASVGAANWNSAPYDAGRWARIVVLKNAGRATAMMYVEIDRCDPHCGLTAP